MSCEERRNWLLAVIADRYGFAVDDLANAVTAITSGRRHRDRQLEPPSAETLDVVASIVGRVGPIAHSQEGTDDYVRAVAQVVDRMRQAGRPVPSPIVRSRYAADAVPDPDSPIVVGRPRAFVERMLAQYDERMHPILRRLMDLPPLPVITWGELLRTWEQAGLDVPPNLVAIMRQTVKVPEFDPGLTINQGLMPVIETMIDGIDHSYSSLNDDRMRTSIHGAWAARGVSWTLIGPPGTGKSTVGRLIAPWIPRVYPDGEIRYGIPCRDYDIVPGNDADSLVVRTTLVSDGSMRSYPGPMLLLMGAGGIAVLNEVQRNPTFAAALQTAAELIPDNRGYARALRSALHGIEVSIPPHALLFFTGNPPFNNGNLVKPLLDRTGMFRMPALSIEERVNRFMDGVDLSGREIDLTKFRATVTQMLHLFEQLETILKDAGIETPFGERFVMYSSANVAMRAATTGDSYDAIMSVASSVSAVLDAFGVDKDVSDQVFGVIQTLASNVYGGGKSGSVRIGNRQR